MTGYIALGEDMKELYGAKSEAYEIDREYIAQSDVSNWFNICKSIIDAEIFTTYTIEKYGIFLVDTLDGEIVNDDNSYCSNKLKLIRKVTKEEIDKYIVDNLEEFTNHEDWKVRAVVVNHGYNLDKLMCDESPYVRGAVAQKGYSLDKLINDKDPIVRAAVATYGYGYNILINDSHPDVRAAVAEQGYGLDVLINDENVFVRTAAIKKDKQSADL